MSIEEKLAEAFKQDAGHKRRPPSLDARIADEYKRQMTVLQGELSMNKSWKISKVVFSTLLAVMILSGFAYAGGKLLFSDQKGGFSLSVRSGDPFNFDAATLGRVQQLLREVKAQLEPGESAVIYTADLNFDGGWLSAYRPVSITDLEQWKSFLKEHGQAEHMSLALPAKFRFAEGMEGNPFSASLGAEDMERWKEMRAESKRTGEPSLWRKAQQKPNETTSQYTSVFRNAAQDSVYLTWSIMDKGAVSAKLLAPPSSEFEKLEWGGHQANYSKVSQWLFGDSGVYQDVMWIQENGGKTIMYRIGSDSVNVTKEQLIEIAKSLM